MGGLITTGLAAEALDHPAAGHGAERHAASPNCPNCRAALAGSFCSDCGQRTPVNRTLTEVGHELLHGITHFDGKACTKLPKLVFRPGRLTRDYIAGKRAR